ncbi:MAG: hypothetical protein ACUZ77_08165 [Candidatus Brocadiales bacterium]
MSSTVQKQSYTDVRSRKTHDRLGSPKIIAGRIKKDHSGLSISHEAIYQYIYHPQTPDRHELIHCLRRAHRKRKEKGIGRKVCKSKIPNMLSIDARLKIVETSS